MKKIKEHLIGILGGLAIIGIPMICWIIAEVIFQYI